MSVFELTLLTAINMMGSGIVMLPTTLAEVGTISILSWRVTAVGSLCLAYAFAKCGMFSKRPGMGGYSEYAFGKSGNFMATTPTVFLFFLPTSQSPLPVWAMGQVSLKLNFLRFRSALPRLLCFGSARLPISWERASPAN